jgi:hypothetical protein
MRFSPPNAAVLSVRDNRRFGGLTPIAAVLLPAAAVGVPIRLSRATAFAQTTRRLPDSVQRRSRSA